MICQAIVEIDDVALAVVRLHCLERRMEFVGKWTGGIWSDGEIA